MRTQILQKLDTLQSEAGIEILLAIESGSRAWGFESPDSDYDVRFMYRRPLDHYLRLSSVRDTLEIPVDEVFDVVGWDLPKVLQALKKSNAVMFEWLQSPVEYRAAGDFRDRLWQLAVPYFNPKSAFHHYLSLAQKSFDLAQLGGQVKLKKFFYVLRPLLAAMWIRDRGTVPPMAFSALRDLLDPEAPVSQAIDRLLATKAVSNEKTVVDAVPELNDFIHKELHRCEVSAADIPTNTKDIGELEDFFRQMVQSPFR